MKRITNKNRGFIQATLVVIVALVILRYTYHIDVIEILTTGKFKIWLDKIYNFGSFGWGKYYEIVFKIWNYMIDFAKNLIAKIK